VRRKELRSLKLSKCEATSKKSSLGNVMSGLWMISVATGRELMLAVLVSRELMVSSRLSHRTGDFYNSATT
jgi:hypothetical protein